MTAQYCFETACTRHLPAHLRRVNAPPYLTRTFRPISEGRDSIQSKSFLEMIHASLRPTTSRVIRSLVIGETHSPGLAVCTILQSVTTEFSSWHKSGMLQTTAGSTSHRYELFGKMKNKTKSARQKALYVELCCTALLRYVCYFTTMPLAFDVPCSCSPVQRT